MSLGKMSLVLVQLALQIPMKETQRTILASYPAFLLGWWYEALRLFVEPVSILTFEPVTVLATDLVALQPIVALKC